MPISDYHFINTIAPIIKEVYAINITNYSQLEDLFANPDWYEDFSKNLNNYPTTIGEYADFTQTNPRYYY